MRLLDALVPRSERAMYPYDALLNSFSFNGVTYPIGLPQQTLRGKDEDIAGDFVGVSQGAYGNNGVVYAVELARLSLFSEARFMFQRMRRGVPGDLFSTPELDVLERPWPGGVTGDLLTAALLDHDLAGNAFIARRDADRGRLRRLRPDWVTIVLGSFDDPDVQAGDIDADLLGYIYHPGGKHSGRDPVILQRTEVAHYRGAPDPLASYRGMSWLTPVLREIAGDSGMTSHKNLYLQNGATPNLVVSLDANILPDQFKTWVQLFKDKEPSGYDVYKTMYLGGGADAKIVGNSLAELDFKVVQGAGETRIAAAGGVPPVIVGLSEGLQAATYSNYGQARRRFADLFARPEWRNFAGSLQTIIPTPPDARLWYDDLGIAFLREDAKDRAEIQGMQAQTIRALVDAGYEPDSVTNAVLAEDWKRLTHTNLYSVQLQPPMPDGPKEPAPPPPPEEPPERALARQLVAVAERRAEAAERRADVVPVFNTYVTTPDVRNEITVEPTPPAAVEVRNEITVEPTPVTVETPAVAVTVEPTPITVEAPVTVNVPEQRSTRKRIVRDDGLITEIIEEPTDG